MKHIYEGELTLSWCGLDENCQFGDPEETRKKRDVTICITTKEPYNQTWLSDSLNDDLEDRGTAGYPEGFYVRALGPVRITVERLEEKA